MNRVSLTPVYVLHTRPYRNTSLLVEFFSQQFGRVSVVAKSARGPKSRFRGLLQSFIPMLASWVGKGELKTLTELELDGMPLQLTGKKLLCGFYLNELLMRMLHRDDPYPHLYQLYHKTLAGLHQAEIVEKSLRLFEKDLLNQLGYGLLLDSEAKTGAAISEAQSYRYHPEFGFMQAIHESEEDHYLFSGKSLLAFHRNELADPKILKDAKRLMRLALSLHLGNKPIMSRELLK